MQEISQIKNFDIYKIPSSKLLDSRLKFSEEIHCLRKYFKTHNFNM